MSRSIAAALATITDANVSHGLTAEATDSPDRAETDTALDALGAKVNLILLALEGHGIVLSA